MPPLAMGSLVVESVAGVLSVDMHATLAHSLQFSTNDLTWFVTPGHHRDDLTLSLHLSIPWWPSWIFNMVSFLREGGTTMQLL